MEDSIEKVGFISKIKSKIPDWSIKRWAIIIVFIMIVIVYYLFSYGIIDNPFGAKDTMKSKKGKKNKKKKSDDDVDSESEKEKQKEEIDDLIDSIKRKQRAKGV